MIVAISIGAVNVPVGDVWGIVLHHVTGADEERVDGLLALYFASRLVGSHSA